jgi:pyruvate/2-oxoglutarate dehydrogenase complex dihydrolipoamide dehydrogenase (E3) component
MELKFDAIVIGTGQSGSPLAGRLAKEGLKTAIIERQRFGGTCVNVGCMPTKTLVASARAAYMARRAGEFGVDVGQVTVDMKRVKARKDGIVGASTKGVENSLKGTDKLTVFEGHASFVGPRRVKVNGDTLTAERVFINVGGRALVPPMPGLGRVPYLTSSSMLEVDFLPKHLVIIGGSYIGLEFAQIYRRFGSRVTVIEMQDRPIAREDEDVSAAVKEILEAEGVEFRLNAKCIDLDRRGDDVVVNVDCATNPRPVIGSHLLLAIGRVPNTADLGLDKAGVKMDARGYIQVDEELRASASGVWAIGDCNGRGAFTHTSYNDYEIVAANMFENGKRRVSDRIAAYGLFVDPPLGRAGMTEREARATGRAVLVAKMPMSSVGRAYERSETQGFMKIVVDAASKRILGAAMLGIGGDEVVQSILAVMYAGQPYTLISRGMYIHPTVTEMLPSLLEDLRPAA